jgi:hypothetical protein
MATSSTGTLLLGFGLAVGAVGVGVWAVRGGGGHHMRGFDGSRRRRGLGGQRHYRRQLRGFGGETEQTELKLFIDNDGDLYRGQTTSIIKNLATKMAKGVYDRTKGEKLWMYLVESGAKKYSREFSDGKDWHTMFDMSDRRQVAKELNDDFLQAWKEGSYRNLLPKKYAGA